MVVDVIVYWKWTTVCNEECSPVCKAGNIYEMDMSLIARYFSAIRVSFLCLDDFRGREALLRTLRVQNRICISSNAVQLYCGY